MVALVTAASLLHVVGAEAVTGTPTDVAAVATSSSRIALTWTAVAGATSYEVYRSETLGGPHPLVKTVTTNSYDNTSRTPATTYYYVVRAVGPEGSSADSAEVSATTPAATPAPTNLAVTGTPTATRVSLSWDPVAGATSYRLYRSTTTSGPYTQVGGTSATVLTDTTAMPTTTYYYVVVALAPAGTSANSNEVSATTAGLPAAPTGVTATPVTSTRVQVAWDPVSGATGYEVWHSTTSGGPYLKKGTLGSASTSFLHTSATPGSIQYYVVRTVAPTGTSANSAQVSATTSALPPPPTNVVASPATPTRVTVSWDPVPGATSYEVWRATTSGGSYTRLAAVFPTSYADNTVASATTYFYVVRTVSTDGTSPNSAEAAVTSPPVPGAPGDILVADIHAFGGPGGLIRVKPATGVRSTVAQNPPPPGSPAFVDPFGIAFAANGDLFMTDDDAFGGGGGVIRVNLVTGARTAVSHNAAPTGDTNFLDPRGIAFAANGDLMVADASAFGGGGGVIRVNPSTGVRTTVSSNAAPTGGPSFADPQLLAIAANGDVITTDLTTDLIIRVDPVTGVRTTVSSNTAPAGDPIITKPLGIAIAANGDLLVADADVFGGGGGVIRVDPVSGARTTVSGNASPTGGPTFVEPFAIAIAPNGDLLVADPHAFGGGGGVIRVDPVSGARTTVSENASPAGGPSFVEPFGIAIQP